MPWVVGCDIRISTLALTVQLGPYDMQIVSMFATSRVAATVYLLTVQNLDLIGKLGYGASVAGRTNYRANGLIESVRRE